MTVHGVGSYLDDLVSHFGDTVKQDAIRWLFQQYAALQAMPQTLTRQRQLITNAGHLIPSDDQASLQQLAGAAAKNATLTAGFPIMIAAVNQAYQTSQQLMAGGNARTNVLNAAAIASAIYNAQKFAQDVTAVDTSIKSVIDSLLASGAITPGEADQLYLKSAQPSTGWGTVLMIGALGIGAVLLFGKRR